MLRRSQAPDGSLSNAPTDPWSLLASCRELVVQPAGECPHVLINPLLDDLPDVVRHPHVPRVRGKPDLLHEALRISQSYIAPGLLGRAPHSLAAAPAGTPPALSSAW